MVFTAFYLGTLPDFETTLREIEWTPGRSGEIAPVAVFDTIKIDSCDVSRASLHNLSFIEGLELMPRDRVLVSKRNMIIPHIEENLNRVNFNMEMVNPHNCPCYRQATRIHENNGTKMLFCDNEVWETRHLWQFNHNLDEFENAVCGQFDFTRLPDFGEMLHQNIY